MHAVFSKDASHQRNASCFGLKKYALTKSVVNVLNCYTRKDVGQIHSAIKICGPQDLKGIGALVYDSKRDDSGLMGSYIAKIPAVSHAAMISNAQDRTVWSCHRIRVPHISWH